MKFKIHKCLECRCEYRCIGQHVQIAHKMSPKDYYDKHLKKENEGICPYCGAETPFKKITQGYASYCCFDHFKKSELVKDHRKKTCLERYGVENCFQSEEKMKKAYDTKLRLYGDIHYRNDEQIKKTCLERYGVENPGGSSVVQDKIFNTYMKHYGCYPSQDPKIRSKIGTRYRFDGIKFDSSYEIAFYIWHRDNNIAIERCKDYFNYEIDGKNHRYFPDFKIGDTYYEIKGKHLLSEDREHLIDPHLKIETKATASKMKCIKDNNVVLLSNSELKFYIKFVKKKYGSEYIKQFKKKQFYE